MCPPDETICAVLLGNASGEETAERLAASMQACPYVSTFRAVGKLVVGVYALPAHRRAWLESAEQSPDVLSLERAAVMVTEKVEASSPWTRGEVKPESDRCPCGAECRPCPLYRKACEGCPATVHFASG